ncbi:MAG: hypothetical protein ACTHJ0_08005 [Flavipsychrobacter sp.]
MNKFYPLLVCRAGKSVSDTNNQQYGQAKLMTTNNEQAANATAFTDE